MGTEGIKEQAVAAAGPCNGEKILASACGCLKIANQSLPAGHEILLS